MLFHDIKPQTAKALPVVLAELKARGYKVVHIRAKQGYEPDLSYTAALQPLLSKAPRRGEVFAGAAEAEIAATGAERGQSAPVTELAPSPKAIVLAGRSNGGAEAAARKPRSTIAYGGSWMTTVRRARPPATEN